MLDATRTRLVQIVDATVGRLLADSPMAGVLTVRAVEVMLVGVLDRLPDVVSDDADTSNADKIDLADLIARVIERGIFHESLV